MPVILPWPEMEKCLKEVDLIEIMKNAFVAYSSGQSIIPPVGELNFTNPPGDVHIKYGYLRDGSQYVVKIASGFYNNPALGLASSQGLMLLFSKKTGCLDAILLDDGRLTDARTGAAGAMSVFYLAKPDISQILIIGAGTQAREQAKALLQATSCRDLIIWARDRNKANQMITDAQKMGYRASFVADCKTAVGTADIIITTTPTTQYLIHDDWVKPGTFIVAVGSDTAEKQEVDSAVLGRADRVIADSLSQAKNRGEIYRAFTSGHLEFSKVDELGQCLENIDAYRQQENEIYVVDLTGVAVQDLAIATAIFTMDR